MGSTVPIGRRRRKQVRSAMRAVQEGHPPPHDRDGDPDLLALVEEPYTAVEETPEHLEALLRAFKARNDRRAIFLSIYARMTEAVARRVRRADFADPDWVGAYLVAFANLYREAVRDYETGALESLADPWLLAFEAAEGGESLVVQDAALGVNAHINYDLALALDEVGIEPDRDTKYRDHREVTDVIRALVDEAQDALIARDADGLATVDESLGRLDEQFCVFTIDECRDSAWRTAVAMNSRFRTRRRLARWINDVTATGAAYLISSSRAVDAVHETLLDRERSP